MRFLIFCLFIFGCTSSNIEESEENIFFEEDRLTGVFSLYPLIENLKFLSVEESDFLDGSRVAVIRINNVFKVYPLSSLIASEMVNDSYGSYKFAVSYCPITKSTIAFERNENFRASGYLYKENLTPWDEKTETIWSQMLFRGIIGQQKGVKLKVIPLVETTWSTIKKYYKNALVFDAPKRSNKTIVKPPTDNNQENSSTEPNSSDIVFGIVDNSDRVNIYNLQDFRSSRIKKTVVDGESFIVVGITELGVINAFKINENEDSFSYLENEFPFVIKGSSGIKYDIFGVSNTGRKLENPKYAYMAAWWAWKDLYDFFIFNNN